MATVATPMTMEEFLALPDDGMDRWLIDGELRERSMTTCNRFHSNVMGRAGQSLNNWLDRQPLPRGKVLVGDAGVRLLHDPDTVVGIDVTYISADVLARQTSVSTIVDGVPTLAVEILSPSDTFEDIHEKIDNYLKAGVPLVWVINPHLRIVMVHQPGAKPQLFNEDQELRGDPHLPGLRIAVRELFV